nr:hypothetical protein GCM10020092_036570 [Actinoplanes digitatis]
MVFDVRGGTTAARAQEGREMPTLQDVAREAGVSKMTVSNVLNGHRDRVSPATIARVMEVVGQLGYVPNATARSLSARRSNLVALAFPGRDSRRDRTTDEPARLAVPRRGRGARHPGRAST